MHVLHYLQHIHYKVVGRGPMTLYNFTGTYVFDLKMAIKEQSQLPYPPDIIKLSAGKHNEAKEDLDELQKVFRKGKSFDLSRLVKEYEIDVDNPISVELPGK